MLRRFEGRFDLVETTVALLVGVYVTVGLERAAGPFWSMVDHGLSSGVRWPGLVLLLAIPCDLLSVFVVRRILPPPRRDHARPIRFALHLVRGLLMVCRWMATLMLLILGLLGLGIDVRADTRLWVVALVLIVPALKEFLIYRWLFKEREVSTEDADTSSMSVRLGSGLLSVPKRLALITFIEEGMFVDVFSGSLVDFGAAELGLRVVLIGCLIIVVAVLYAVLIYLPLRSPDLIRMIRQRRYLAWLPGFCFEVGCIVVHILSG